MDQILTAVMPLAATFEELEAVGNELTLSADDLQRLAQLPRLRTLTLDDNAIVLEAETASAFGQLTGLETLSLNGNPLERAPHLAQMSALAQLELSQARLTQFPPGLLELMNRNPPSLRGIDLSSNAITEVPDLTETRFVRLAREARDDVESPHYGNAINLDGNPLNEASRGMLRRASIDFYTDPESDEGALGPHPDEWLIGCPEPLREQVEAERATPEAAEFYDLMSRVVNTADYRSDPAETRRRAWQLVETWLRPDQEIPPGLSQLRERLFALAQDAQGTCGDGVALTLDEMESEVEAWRRVVQAQGGGDAPLRALLSYQRGLWRRALIDEIARAVVRARIARHTALTHHEPAPPLHPADDIQDAILDQGLDEVEVRFYLFQKLEGVLELPPPRGMLYNARVSGNTAQRVGVEVLQRDTDAAFAQWVARQPGFRAYLEHGYARQFEPVREEWQAAADAIYDAGLPDAPRPALPSVLSGLADVLPQLDWQGGTVPGLNDQETRIAYDWVSQGRERALEALALRLTRQLLGADQAGPSGRDG